MEWMEKKSTTKTQYWATDDVDVDVHADAYDDDAVVLSIIACMSVPRQHKKKKRPVMMGKSASS